MKPNNHQRYRQILSRIVQNCQVHCGRTVEEPLVRADWEEQATELHDRYVAFVDEEIRWETCEAARRALARLEQGEFGRCVDCGVEISPKRLAAIPWTERCVRCQARTEQNLEPLAAEAYFPDAERDAA
jgi:RNA polymerase-binding transcription factor DksA